MGVGAVLSPSTGELWKKITFQLKKHFVNHLRRERQHRQPFNNSSSAVATLCFFCHRTTERSIHGRLVAEIVSLASPSFLFPACPVAIVLLPPPQWSTGQGYTSLLYTKPWHHPGPRKLTGTINRPQRDIINFSGPYNTTLAPTVKKILVKKFKLEFCTKYKKFGVISAAQTMIGNKKIRNSYIHLMPKQMRNEGAAARAPWLGTRTTNERFEQCSTCQHGPC